MNFLCLAHKLLTHSCNCRHNYKDLDNRKFFITQLPLNQCARQKKKKTFLLSLYSTIGNSGIRKRFVASSRLQWPQILQATNVPVGTSQDQCPSEATRSIVHAQCPNIRSIDCSSLRHGALRLVSHSQARSNQPQR